MSRRCSSAWLRGALPERAMPTKDDERARRSTAADASDERRLIVSRMLRVTMAADDDAEIGRGRRGCCPGKG